MLTGPRLGKGSVLTDIKNPDVIDFSEISDEQMNEMIDGTLTEFDEGDLVDGTIVKIERDEVLVDIGFKSEGVIPARELSIRKDADPSELVEVGDKIEALVLQKEDKDGRLILSKKRAEYERSWIAVEEKFKAGEPVTGEVIEVVKGGLIIDIGLRGFLPASLVDLRRVKDLDMYLNTELEARIIEMDRNRNNVVLSRRVLLEEGRKNERAEILAKLTKGMRLKGTVSSIVDFGAFVDLGGIDGLVHISELSWNHVNHPSEVVKVGQEVEVEVLDVDLNRERISLGLKQTQPDPWVKLVESYPVGTIVDGTVTKIVPFGAFVQLGEATDGLVHISEMAPRHIDAPAQVVHVGDVVKVKVMEINPERRRISLSMKAAAAELGIEIEIDESVVVEERPARKPRREADEEAAPEAAEAPAEEAAPAEAAPAEEAPATEEAAE
ncbi:MAG: 30S ribosomal protein S1 [Eggerthellaceae bacterium]|nr:30S ribosomal protein S1 [Eggerthellaceae bacterium]